METEKIKIDGQETLKKKANRKWKEMKDAVMESETAELIWTIVKSFGKGCLIGYTVAAAVFYPLVCWAANLYSRFIEDEKLENQFSNWYLNRKK